jgi:predicted O-linked N-acetylglucosamine transferase (SPINDLY family)
MDPARIIFMDALPHEEYLARHALADLFLDTFPYNAGATGNNALWMGLPLVTCQGNTLAGRFGGPMAIRASQYHQRESSP